MEGYGVEDLNNQSYDEFTLNFKLEEDVPIDQFEMTMYMCSY